MKLLFPALLFSFTTFFLSCSSKNNSSEEMSSPPKDASVAPSQTFPIQPDDNFVLASETYSEFGPPGVIRDVIVDRNGIVWLASWEGVVSYDGKTFTNHTLQDNLSHHRIFSLCGDSKGNLWFGTMGAGVFRYDGSKFTNLNMNHGLAGNNVWCIFEDMGGKIWFGTDSGACWYDGIKFKNLSTETDSVIGSVNAICQDLTGAMWIAASRGLFLYSPVTRPHGDQAMVLTSFLTEHGTPYTSICDIQRDNDGVIWIGATRGLYKCVVRKHVQTQVTTVNEDFNSYISLDHQGNLLLSTDGLYRYNQTNFDTIVNTPPNTARVFGASEDNKGNVWYGSMNGLHKFDGTSNVSFKSNDSGL